MDVLLSILAGVGLAAATGFRVFIPPLVVSVAARTGFLSLGPGLEWMASDVALVAFAVAASLEVGAYFVPWLDNLLDTLTTPTALVAGILLAGSVVVDLTPWLRWTVAVLAGGGAAATFQGLTAGGRQISSWTTVGLANPLLAAGELVASLLLSVLAVLAPVVAFAVLVVLGVVTVSRLLTRRRRPAAVGEGP